MNDSNKMEASNSSNPLEERKSSVSQLNERVNSFREGELDKSKSSGLDAEDSSREKIHEIGIMHVSRSISTRNVPLC